MITPIKLTSKDKDEQVIVSLEQMPHMIRKTDNFGKEYTEIHFANSKVEVNEPTSEVYKAITSGLMELSEEL